MYTYNSKELNNVKIDIDTMAKTIIDSTRDLEGYFIYGSDDGVEFENIDYFIYIRNKNIASKINNFFCNRKTNTICCCRNYKFFIFKINFHINYLKYGITFSENKFILFNIFLYSIPGNCCNKTIC